MREVDFLIQGAGIGGLTLAVALARKGYRIHLFERSPQLSEVGAGIWMAPNALQVFAQLGLTRAIGEAGWPVREVALFDSRGYCLQKLGLEPQRELFGFETIALHRARLQKLIAQAVPADQISFSCEVGRLNETRNGIDVTDTRGRDWRSSFLIGADGLKSALRQRIFPNSRIRYSGSSSYRAVSRQPGADYFSHQSREIWAPGCRLGFSAISEDLVYWYMTFDAAAGVSAAPAENYEHATALFRQHFPAHLELINRVEHPEKIIRTDISDLVPLAAWFQGRIVLIGDAAHATTPNLGQGAAQAVEDALVFAEEMAHAAMSPAALAAFVRRRKNKADWIARTSWNIGRLCHMRNPVWRGLRNLALAKTPARVSHRQLARIYTLT